MTRDDALVIREGPRLDPLPRRWTEPKLIPGWALMRHWGPFKPPLPRRWWDWLFWSGA
jgi:hypothetical protein